MSSIYNSLDAEINKGNKDTEKWAKDTSEKLHSQCQLSLTLCLLSMNKSSLSDILTAFRSEYAITSNILVCLLF